jgi:hypothetical protein
MTYYSNAVAIPEASVSAFERYAADPGDVFGDYLLFNGKTGDWTAGKDKREVPLGTKLIALLSETAVGFLRWNNGSAEKALMPLSSDPNLKELRKSLGDLDADAWEEETFAGMPKDPWQEAILLPLVDPESLDAFTFSTSSFGGRKAAKRLIRACIKQVRAAPETTTGHLPLIELGTSSYQHSNNKIGTIYAPKFEVLDWVPTSAANEALAHHGFGLARKDLDVEPTA